MRDVYARREQGPGLRMAFEPEHLRLFQPRFEPRAPFLIAGERAVDAAVAT